MDEKVFLAIDLGASSGRAVLGRLGDGKLAINEVHRFPNIPVEARGVLYWDALSLWREICESLRIACHEAGGALAGVGVDTWGVDFGLLDAKGRLISNPVHYRDKRNNGVMERVIETVGREKIFSRTGIQFLPFNTLYQLMAMKMQGWPELGRAETLLMMPNLFSYFLCGSMASEFSIASTTQFYDPIKKGWAYDLLKEMGLPIQILTEIVEPGSVLGYLENRTIGIPAGVNIPVIAPASHDTGSAVAAVPADAGQQGCDWAYISSGTWSLMGIEVPRPILTEAALKHNFTNEGGAQGTFRFLKNITGLWPVQECRRIWALEDRAESGYDKLQSLAREAEQLARFIDPDHPTFLLPENMVDAIGNFCSKTGQKPPKTRGEYVRCILESLALKYAKVKREIEETAGNNIRLVNVVGGGSQDDLLNQLSADAMGVPVIAGPAEATAIGNILVQAIGSGVIPNLAAARMISRQSLSQKVYEPTKQVEWERAMTDFDEIESRGKALTDFGF